MEKYTSFLEKVDKMVIRNQYNIICVANENEDCIGELDEIYYKKMKKLTKTNTYFYAYVGENPMF